MMHYKGDSYELISNKTDIPVSTLTTYFSRAWKADFEEYQLEQNTLLKKQALNILRAELNKASITLVGLLENKNPRIQLSAAKEILDRVIGKPESVDLDRAFQPNFFQEVLKKYDFGSSGNRITDVPKLSEITDEA